MILSSFLLLFFTFEKLYYLTSNKTGNPLSQNLEGQTYASHLVTWFLVVFGDEVTKILRNILFTFFTEQGKTGKMEI